MLVAASDIPSSPFVYCVKAVMMPVLFLIMLDWYSEQHVLGPHRALGRS